MVGRGAPCPRSGVLAATRFSDRGSGTLSSTGRFRRPARRAWLGSRRVVHPLLSSSLTRLPSSRQESAMTMSDDTQVSPVCQDARLLMTLQRLLAIQSTDLRPALDEAA